MKSEIFHSTHLRVILLAAGLSMLVSCATPELTAPKGGQSAAPGQVQLQVKLPPAGKRLGDLQRLKAIDREIAASLVALEEKVALALVDRQRLGYYSNRQHSALERAFVQFRGLARQLDAVHRAYAFWEAPSSRGRDKASAEELEAAVIGFYAERLQFHATAAAVQSLQLDPSVITKFNEAFLRSDEPRGTFDRLFHSVTSSDDWRRRVKGEHAMARLGVSNMAPPFAAGLQRAIDLHASSGKVRKLVIKRGYAAFPELSNELHHTLLAAWVRENRSGFTDRIRSARNVLFAEVAAIPYPGEDLSEFTPAQKRRLHRLLQPGDVLLTYTGGYMSNLFLPGTFKHAITYVGHNGQRRKAGLNPSRIDFIDGGKFTRLREHLEIERLGGTSGQMPADVIEAVAEGVIFNSLDHLLDTHTTRIIALRPKLTPDERRSFLLRVFSLLGTKYDFAFDFGDASSHCCTEVVYRALNQTGRVEFSLSKRGGYYNMSGDDIVKAHYARPGAFEVVFLAMPEGDDKGKEKTRILKGGGAEQQLRSLVPGEQ
ncbi:MAG: YiiX/YebB-like N1pC/P60 family cysteine hydrolase [Verrucomicrobia bacterium]|nr:YiiX/YebB-like N1pC/P60 family cysteine hydrolase [Verrucomicrobiota bacterium]